MDQARRFTRLSGGVSPWKHDPSHHLPRRRNQGIRLVRIPPRSGIAPVLQVAITKRWLARGITSADCVRLTWIGAALLAAYHLWVIAGLPGVNA